MEPLLIETGIPGTVQETDYQNATLQNVVYGGKGYAINIATRIVPEAFPIDVMWENVPTQEVEQVIARVVRELLAPIVDEGALTFEVQIGTDPEYYNEEGN